MIIGELGDMKNPLLFVGGNCAIQGFDHQGEDKFWTVRIFCDCCEIASTLVLTYPGNW